MIFGESAARKPAAVIYCGVSVSGSGPAPDCGAAGRGLGLGLAAGFA